MTTLTIEPKPLPPRAARICRSHGIYGGLYSFEHPTLNEVLDLAPHGVIRLPERKRVPQPHECICALSGELLDPNCPVHSGERA